MMTVLDNVKSQIPQLHIKYQHVDIQTLRIQTLSFKALDDYKFSATRYSPMQAIKVKIVTVCAT